jgi:nitrogen fixation NifU-like protein
MNDDFEKLIEKIQHKIENDMEKTFSEKVIKEYKNPCNFGIIKNPDSYSEIKGPCGDTMKISLKIKDNRINNIQFWTDGCGPTIACGSMLTKEIKGMKIQEAKKYTSSQLLKALDGLPLDHHHCTKLAVNTLHSAIDNY